MSSQIDRELEAVLYDYELRHGLTPKEHQQDNAKVADLFRERLNELDAKLDQLLTKLDSLASSNP